MDLIGFVGKKIVGREANRYAVVVDEIDARHLLIDGNVKRRRCNRRHLVMSSRKLKIPKGASTDEVHAAMTKAGIPVNRK